MLMPAKRSRVAIAVAAAGVALLAAAASSEARVTQITITNTTSPFDGRVFGDVGAYEQIRGTATGELDPFDPPNAVITDINFAPRNANGKVAYTTSFTLLKPVDMSRSSGVMVYEVVNRGSQAPAALHARWNDGRATPPAMASSIGPETSTCGAAGRAISSSIPRSRRKLSRCPWPRASPVRPLPALSRLRERQHAAASRGGGVPPANLDTTQAKLISIARESNLGVRSGVVEIASGDWAFADCASTPFPGTPERGEYLPRNGFDPALVYELVYTAKDPLVLGVGMAAMRDVVSFFRRASAARRQPDRRPDRCMLVGYGISQSGRYHKNFILLGFNEDEDGQDRLGRR